MAHHVEFHVTFDTACVVYTFKQGVQVDNSSLATKDVVNVWDHGTSPPLSKMMNVQGSLKIHFAHLKHGYFSKIKGNHHLQGNVQVYDVRIPVHADHELRSQDKGF